jgi:hypothetical protein
VALAAFITCRQARKSKVSRVITAKPQDDEDADAQRGNPPAPEWATFLGYGRRESGTAYSSQNTKATSLLGVGFRASIGDDGDRINFVLTKT